MKYFLVGSTARMAADLERFPKSVKRFSDKKRAANNGLERRSDSIRSKCALAGIHRNTAIHFFDKLRCAIAASRQE